MLSLFDELAKESEPAHCCAAGAWMAALSAEDRQLIEQWVADGKSKTALWRACVRTGLRIGRTTFGDHVGGHVSRR